VLTRAVATGPTTGQATVQGVDNIEFNQVS